MIKPLLKISLLFSVLFCTQLQAYGQSLLLFAPDSSFRSNNNFLQFEAGAYYRSNSLTNEYFNRMAWGGFYGPDAKEGVERDLADLNRLGGEGKAGLTYWNMSDSLFSRPNLGMKLHVHSKYDASMSFTNDLYQLVYNGNKQFAGSSALMDGSSAEYYAYQKLGLGIFDKRTLSSLSVSYVNGQDYVQSIVNTGDLYTSQLGDSLQLTYNGSHSQSFSPNRGFGSGDGSGVALDLLVNYPLASERGFISLQLEDVGFVYWNNITTYAADSSLLFQGVDVSDILASEFDEFELPSLQDTLVYDSTQSSEIKMLPMSLGISLMHQVEDDGILEVGLRIKPTRAHVPELYGKYHYIVNPTTWVSATARFGGYGKFRVGAEYQKLWKGWLFTLGTDDVPGLILNSFHGRGAYFSVGRFFGSNNARNT